MSDRGSSQCKCTYLHQSTRDQDAQEYVEAGSHGREISFGLKGVDRQSDNDDGGEDHCLHDQDLVEERDNRADGQRLEEREHGQQSEIDGVFQTLEIDGEKANHGRQEQKKEKAWIILKEHLHAVHRDHHG